MSEFFKKGILLLIMALSAAGCLAGKVQNNEVLPAHDEVLIYKLPYDLTYLRTTEALEHAEGWQLEGTEKEKGRITVRNMDYTQLDDSDRRVATFIVKRVNRQETSVELAPESQKIVGGGALMDKVAEFVSSEL